MRRFSKEVDEKKLKAWYPYLQFSNEWRCEKINYFPLLFNYIKIMPGEISIHYESLIYSVLYILNLWELK